METVSIIIAAGVILFVSIALSIAGLGGGVLYVPILLAFGMSIHDAAVTSLFVIAVMSVSAATTYYRRGTVDWKLVLFLEPLTAILAFVGGMVAKNIDATTLIIIFAGMLFIASILLITPLKDRQANITHSWSYWSRKTGDNSYVVHLSGLIPVSTVAGFVAGMIGISGGVFKMPAMVLIGRVPMRIAIGTSSLMVAITSIAGLLGHVTNGSFDILTALPLAAAAFLGGYIGPSLSRRVKVSILNKYVAVILAIISIWMIVSITT